MSSFFYFHISLFLFLCIYRDTQTNSYSPFHPSQPSQNKFSSWAGIKNKKKARGSAKSHWHTCGKRGLMVWWQLGHARMCSCLQTSHFCPRIWVCAASYFLALAKKKKVMEHTETFELNDTLMKCMSLADISMLREILSQPDIMRLAILVSLRFQNCVERLNLETSNFLWSPM